MTKQKVAVLGGGNGAFAVASDLGARGFEVSLFEDPGHARSLDAVASQGGILIDEPDPLGHEVAFAPIACATYDAALAVTNAELVVFVVPGYAERRFMDLVRPHLRPDQVVLFGCGTFGAALEFLAVLGQDSDVPSIAEFEALPVGGFKSGPAAVRLSGRKRGIGIAVLTDRDRLALSVVRAFYEDAVPVGSVLETSLGNLNPVLHPPIMILNAGRLKGIPQPFELYTEGVTPSVAKVIDALDTERVLVGSKFGLPLVPALARLQQWYAGIDRATSIFEAVTSNPAYEHVWAPSALQHRFLTEDVPYGLVPLEGLARLIECDVPITSALVSLTSAMLDTDVRVEGRSVERLGLDGLSRAAILARVTPRDTNCLPARGLSAITPKEQSQTTP